MELLNQYIAPIEVEVSSTGDVLIRKAATQIAYMSLANISFQV